MKIVTCITLLSLVLIFSGCATLKAPVSEKNLKAEVDRLKQENQALAAQRDTYKSETNQIKTQVDALQSSLSEEKQKTTELESKIESLSSELESFKGTTLYEEKPTVTPDDFTKKVQLALYTAGFDPGKIDGKMGPQTVQAVKNFQEANALKVDGIVGKETWEKLQGYLEMK
jgi:murein L,D-transpeptidase YcbB/YkuD